MLAALTNLPMDGAVGVALVSMFVSFSMSLFGLLRNVKPAKRRMERNHDCDPALGRLLRGLRLSGA